MQSARMSARMRWCIKCKLYTRVVQNVDGKCPTVSLRGELQETRARVVLNRVAEFQANWLSRLQAIKEGATAAPETIDRRSDSDDKCDARPHLSSARPSKRLKSSSTSAVHGTFAMLLKSAASPQSAQRLDEKAALRVRQVSHARMHAHAHARTHASTHACTHASANR